MGEIVFVVLKRETSCHTGFWNKMNSGFVNTKCIFSPFTRDSTDIIDDRGKGTGKKSVLQMKGNFARVNNLSL